MSIPVDQLDSASLQRLALNFYREALLGNIDFGGGGGANPLLFGGWANYITGDPTPVTLPAGVATALPLDASQGTIREDFLPLGTSRLWDSTTGKFDFSGLNIGDTVSIRIDGVLTTTTFNDSFLLELVAAEGSPSEFTLPFASGTRLFAGSGAVSRFNELYIGSQDMIDNPAGLYATASANATGFLINIYIRVNRFS